MIFFAKLVAIILALVSISKSYLDYRKGQEPLTMFIFWLIVWSVTTILVAYPLLIEQINLYFKDGAVSIGSLTSVAFVFLLFIVYRIYAKAARIEYQLGQLARKISLDKPEVVKK